MKQVEVLLYAEPRFRSALDKILDATAARHPWCLGTLLLAGCVSRHDVAASTQREAIDPVTLVAPAGSNHDCWTNGVSAATSCVTALQPATNADGTYEVRFSQLALSRPYQSVGLMLYEDEANFLRFELWTMGTGVFVDVWTVLGGRGASGIDGPAVALGTDAVLRVVKSGDTFTYSYSLDGATFATAGSISAPLLVNKLGPYVDNAGDGNAPFTSAAYSDLRIPDGGSPPPPPPPNQPRKLAPSGPIVIDGQSSGLVEGLRITSTSGDCLTIRSSFNVTVRASEIGPCAGNAVVISGGGTITIVDNYIHPERRPTGCCDTGDGVLAANADQVTIAGNVIAYSESNIEVLGSTHVHASGNFLLNPQNGGARGSNFQSWNGSADIVIENNYALASTDPSYTLPENQSDSINFGATDRILVRNNYVEGGHWAAGCGIIADDAANDAQFLNNVLVNTGQVGINVGSGTNQIVDGNRVFSANPIEGGGNTAITVWNEYEPRCGPVTVTNNIAAWLKPDGSESGFWNGGGCEPLTSSGNTFDAEARALLTPIDQKLPRPPIPPGPVACLAPSPYTTQTGWPPCATP